MRPAWDEAWRSLLTLEATRDRDRWRRLEAARRFMEASALDGVLLDDVARHACFSPAHFHRLFHEEYGLTPHAWMARVRLDRARRLLRETDRPVTEVCLAVGYRSLGSFSSWFARELGEPPSGYRRRFVQSGWAARPPIPCCFLLRHGGR